MKANSNLKKFMLFQVNFQLCAILFFITLSFPGLAQITSKIVTTGGYRGGSLFTVNTDGSNPSNWFDFPIANNEGRPYSSLTMDGSEIWGITYLGGKSDDGTIFKMNDDGSEFQILHQFESEYGRNPVGQLILLDGYYWGMTRFGGESDQGTIFRIKEDGTQFEKLFDFDRDSLGGEPYGSLVVFEDKLWAVAVGGQEENGVLFNFDPNTLTHSLIYDFTEIGIVTDDLLLHNGIFWGIAKDQFHAGKIFSIDPTDTSTFELRHEFSGTDGRDPVGQLSFIDGKIWGVTESGGSTENYGTIFTINEDGSGFAKVRDFDFDNGSRPSGTLMEFNGKIWGLTRSALLGSSLVVGGVVFRMDLNGTNYEVLHMYDQSDSFQGGLVEGDDRIFGLSEGSVFSFSADSDDYNALYSFSSGTKYGTSPRATTLYDNKIYGVTSSLMYSVDYKGENFTILHEFTEPGPNELFLYNDKFYGLTTWGGEHGKGTIISIETDGTGYTVLHDFEGGAGANPQGGLVEANGKLWGMTYSGGTVVDIYTDYGVIFSIDPDGNNYTVVHEFDRLNGNTPKGSLTKANGKLWGLTSNTHYLAGGLGVIFSIDTLTGDNYEVHHTFESSAGTNPEGSLTLSNDKLWGMTPKNGAFNAGSIFSIDLDGSNFSEVKGFDLSVDGGEPTGTLIEYDNLLWGTTDEGGENNLGTIFSIGTDGSGFNKIYDCESIVGGLPISNKLVVLEIEKEAQNITFELADKNYGNDAFNFEASSNSTEPILFTSSDENVIQVVDGIATIVNAGEVTITASQEGTDYYIEGSVMQDITVGKAPLTITADDLEKIYGDENPDLTLNYSGFVYEDTPDSLDTQPEISTTATSASDAGNYDISVTSASDANYEITQVNGTLTISKATLIATADDQSRTYGQENPELTISYEGFVNGENEEDLVEEPSATTEATITSGVGEYTVILSSVSDNNYQVTSENGLLTITKATLNAIADNITIKEGDPIPTFTITYNGFVNDDTVEDITEPTISTEATTPTVAGEYDIVLDGGEAINYELNLLNGVLTVELITSSLPENAGFSMYPNPTNGIFHIDLNESLKDFLIHVYNSNGQLIKELSNDAGTQNLSDLKNGVYLIVLSDHEKQYFSRLIKN